MKNVVHSDYDMNTPTPYFVLDTRGGKLQEYLDRLITSFGLLDHSAQQDDGMSMLSEREKEVAVLLGEGYTNQEIVAELYITEDNDRNETSFLFGESLSSFFVREEKESIPKFDCFSTFG